MGLGHASRQVCIVCSVDCSLSSIGVVLVTVTSLAVSLVVAGEVVAVIETALTWGVRLLSFLVEVSVSSPFRVACRFRCLSMSSSRRLYSTCSLPFL